jgi:predicted ferric reductase
VYPWLRTCFEYGLSQKAVISVDNSGFIRLAIPATFDWVPGQHCFLRFTSFGLLQAVSTHPFTICSSPSVELNAQSELIFYIRPHRGLTAKLHAHAMENPGSSLPVFVDGPYGGINTQNIIDTDHALVIAGGSGAGWCLPFVEHFIRSRECSRDASLNPSDTSQIEKGLHANNSTTSSSLRVVLATRDSVSRKWFLGAVDELLAKYNTSELLSNVQVEVHLTGKAAQEANLPDKGSEGISLPSDQALPDKEIAKANDEHQGAVAGEFEGRPQLPMVIKQEAELVRERHQSLSVFVCGPITMQNDARNAVAAENLSILKGSKAGGISLYSEHFSWA